VSPHMRCRRYHCGRCQPDRPGAKIQLHHPRLRSREPSSDGHLLLLIVWVIGLAVPVTPPTLSPRLLPHPPSLCSAFRFCSPHVHLLLCAPLRGLPADGPLLFRCSGLNRWKPYKTTMMAWKYTLPAFLFPFTFVLDPSGVGLLLKGPIGNMLWVIFMPLQDFLPRRRC